MDRRWLIESSTGDLVPCPNGCASPIIQNRINTALGVPTLDDVSLDVPFNAHMQPIADVVRSAIRERQPIYALLVGGFGVGKTHILQGAVRMAVGLGHDAAYIIWADMEAALRLAVAEDRLHRLERLLKTVAVLAIDEIDKGHDTDFTRSSLLRVLEARYRNAERYRLLTLMAANTRVEKLPGYIVSRAKDGRFGLLRELWDAPDMRPLLKKGG